MNKNKVYEIDAAAHLAKTTAAEQLAVEKDIEAFTAEKDGAPFLLKEIVEKLRAKKHRDKLISENIWNLFQVQAATAPKRDYSELWNEVNSTTQKAAEPTAQPTAQPKRSAGWQKIIDSYKQGFQF